MKYTLIAIFLGFALYVLIPGKHDRVISSSPTYAVSNFDGTEVVSWFHHGDTTIELLISEDSAPLWRVEFSGMDTFYVEAEDDATIDTVRMLLGRCMDDECVEKSFVRFWYE